jgi:hypothetical protein
MAALGFIGLMAIAAGAYRWLALPRLRRLRWWGGFLARVRALCGNSKTLAVAYGVELIGILDEARLLDWSELVGSQNAGRVMVAIGAVMILLRLVTRGAVSFRAEG